eukprot:gene12-4263_t
MGKKNIKNQTQSFEDIKEKALQYLDSYEYQAAITYFNFCLQKKPDSTEIIELLGTTYMSINDPDSARNCFKKAVKISPKIGYSKYMYLGQLSEGKKALDYYNKGISILQAMKTQQDCVLSSTEIQTYLIDAYCSVAELFMTDLCFEKNAENVCEECLIKSQKEDPEENNLNYLQTAANLRLVQQKKDEAKKIMSKLFTLLQKGSIASYEFKISATKILIELEEYSAAMELLVLLTEDFDQIVDVWYLMGLCLKLQKEFKSAIDHFNKGLEIAKVTDEDPEFVKVLKDEIKECSKEKFDNEDEEEEIDDDDEYITDDDLDIMDEEFIEEIIE